MHNLLLHLRRLISTLILVILVSCICDRCILFAVSCLCLNFFLSRNFFVCRVCLLLSILYIGLFCSVLSFSYVDGKMFFLTLVLFALHLGDISVYCELDSLCSLARMMVLLLTLYVCSGYRSIPFYAGFRQ